MTYDESQLAAIENAIVYRGFSRETEVRVTLTFVTPEIAIIQCIECGGSGIWVGHPERTEKCVECKGTGKIYVS